jgi:ferritin-like metal-binding protein YciE
MAENKILQYLNEAHATEVGLIRVLQSQIAVTPRGGYRTALERHLRETRDHASRLERRLGELDSSAHLVQTAIGAAETVLAQGLAIGKFPIDLLRGNGGAEKVLKNAKDAAASEALEIATYTAIERLAQSSGDSATARLAASIRADEERMLAGILDEIPNLVDAVLGGRYDLAKTGAGETARAAGRAGAAAAKRGTAKAKRTARSAPGAARAEGTARGAVASAGDLPIARYDALTADEVVAKLRDLSQVELAKVETYERRHEDRTTVIERIQTLRTREPWPGYDELTVEEITTALGKGTDTRARAARDYERAHKNRAGVLERAERELSAA